MELETVILETNDTQEMDLGEAQQAYSDYPQIREILQGKLAEWKTLVNSLKSKGPDSITKPEINKAEGLAEGTEKLQQECLDMRAMLCRKLEDLILEGKELEGGVSYLAKHCSEEDIEWGNSLLKDALQLKDSGTLIEAVEKAYQAREAFTQLLAEAKGKWVQGHQERVNKACDREGINMDSD